MAIEEFTAPDGTKFTVDVTFTFLCRCGQTVRVGYVCEPISADGRPGVVLHVDPRCGQFQRLNPLDFVRWVRTGVEIMH